MMVICDKQTSQIFPKSDKHKTQLINIYKKYCFSECKKWFYTFFLQTIFRDTDSLDIYCFLTNLSAPINNLLKFRLWNIKLD